VIIQCTENNYALLFTVTKGQVNLIPNSTMQAEHSSLQLTCIISPTMNDFVYWRRRQFGAASETGELAIVYGQPQCTMSPAIPPSYMQCNCRSREYTCVLKNLTRAQNGDLWKCVGAYANGQEVSSQEATIQIVGMYLLYRLNLQM
jgi:hypothetical protein